MAKTPFEIRLDLLQLANVMLSDRTFAERQRLEQDWNTQREHAFSDLSHKPSIEELPQFPWLPAVDPDEVIELAKKMNDFVSNG